ncbi:hypothetical protein FH972_019562 [Carpinus fangiana]|uniref:Uncharacterized protein n=1 Tax=Carpinus fangiana TaxID=176857 RepID=A0A5N6RQM1_9ROSI|nr:hypothetical protein FH972_019562 [Carpinus fangiana]
MALYLVFNKGEVEDVIEDQLISSLNKINQKKILLKDKLASHYSIWLEICVELLLVTIHDSSTTNVFIYNLLQTTIAHPFQEEEALEEEADLTPPMVEGTPFPVSDMVKGPPSVVDVVAALDPALVVDEEELWTHLLGGREGGALNPPAVVLERRRAMDPTPEEATSVVEE